MYDRKILVTGAAGFIGSHLCERLVEGGQHVVGLDDLSTGSPENITALDGNPRFEFVRGNLLGSDKLTDIIRDCETVFHLAASRDVRLGTSDTKVDFETNLVGTRALLEGVRESPGCHRIIFTSTSTVYGEPLIIPTPENYGPLQPLSLYGASKLGCEGMISAYGHLFGIQAVICRLANVVGPRCDHGIVHDLMIRILKNGRELEVFGNGNQLKSYLHIDDCIDALMLLEHEETPEVDFFNIGSSDALHVKDIVGIVKKTVGVEAESVERYLDQGDGRGWPGDVRLMLLDCSKMQVKGWVPKYSSALAIEATANGIFSSWRNSEKSYLLNANT